MTSPFWFGISRIRFIHYYSNRGMSKQYPITVFLTSPRRGSRGEGEGDMEGERRSEGGESGKTRHRVAT